MRPRAFYGPLYLSLDLFKLIFFGGEGEIILIDEVIFPGRECVISNSVWGEGVKKLMIN